MGGLVARSACHYAAAERRRMGAGASATWSRSARRTWARRSSRPCTWRSAGLARASRRCGRSARFLRRRSAGIRDLRHGSLVDEDWRDRDPDALRAAALAEVPLLDGATHCFVAATITRSPRHPVGRLIGDLLVLEAERVGPRRATGGSRSARSTACTSAARTTSRCSTTRRSTSGLRDWLARAGRRRG